MSEIQKTKDYEKFKILKGNRPIDKYHLKRLQLSIEMDNQLHLHPIIVDKDFYIIDGQHRLEAARLMNAEIFYVLSENVEMKHIISCNAHQKSWDTINYIEYFALKEKNQEYILFKQLMARSGLSPKPLLNLIIGVASNSLLEFLKTGKFRMPIMDDSSEMIEFYLDFISYVSSRKITPYSMFKKATFTQALRFLFTTSGFSKEIFFSKLDNRWFELKPHEGAEKWYKLLLGIYNYKNQDKLIDVLYGDR